MNYGLLLDNAKTAALLAGQEILKVYSGSKFGVSKKDDKSPLTLADKTAHKVITEILNPTNLPILSEEGVIFTYEERKHWNAFWMVDPLDGTKEFIKRNDEFTVNISLIENNVPVLGVVFSPVLNKLYYGGTAINNAYLLDNGNEKSLPKSEARNLNVLKNKEISKILVSRSYLNQETTDFINTCINPDLISMGSSLKFMILAENNADIYPRFAPSMEWDTAASDAILRSLGKYIHPINYNIPSRDLIQYNKANLLNPYFIAY